MDPLSLLLPIGATVVKLALRLNDPSGSDFADAIDDTSALFSHFATKSQSRQARRSADALIEEIARGVLTNREHEFRDLAENDINAAVLEVHAAVTRALPLTSGQRGQIMGLPDPSLAIRDLILSTSNPRKWATMHGGEVANLIHILILDVSRATVALLRAHPQLSIDMLATLMQSGEKHAAALDGIRTTLDEVLFVTRSLASQAVSLANVPEQSSESFLVEHAYDSYTLPASPQQKYRVFRSVTVKAIRDNVTEYRYTVARSSIRGAGDPELELLAGPGAHFERLTRVDRNGEPGYEYQVVIPLDPPMSAHDGSRTFSWVVRSTVDDSFFEEGDGTTRCFGFRPSRELRSARVAVRFAGKAPEIVGVVTDAPLENSEIFDSDGETLRVTDGFVEKEWTNLRLARFYYLVWPR